MMRNIIILLITCPLYETAEHLKMDSPCKGGMKYVYRIKMEAKQEMRSVSRERCKRKVTICRETVLGANSDLYYRLAWLTLWILVLI